MASNGVVPGVEGGTDRPEKLGGWLYLPAFGLVIGPISLAVVIFVVGVLLTTPTNMWGLPDIARGDTPEAHAALDSYSAQVHTLQKALTSFVVLETLLFLLMLFAAILFFRKRRKAPAALIAMLIAQIVVNGVMTAIFILADGQLAITRNVPGLATQTAISFAGDILAAAIWIPYFLRSKRVKRTFLVV